MHFKPIFAYDDKEKIKITVINEAHFLIYAWEFMTFPQGMVGQKIICWGKENHFVTDEALFNSEWQLFLLVG